MTSKEKLEKIRAAMDPAGLDACIIPSSDPHMSEYLPGHWKIMEWLTGFTGSAGTVVITRDFAGVWTDSRYFIQAEDQLKDSGFELVKLVIPHDPEYINWLAGTLCPHSRIGYDGRIVSVTLSQKIRNMAENNGLEVNEEPDLISALWKDRPPLPHTPVFIHDKKYTGISAAEKMEKIRIGMEKHKAGVLLVTALDEISWLMNIRAADIDFNPVAVAYAMIFPGEARLYIDPAQISQEVEEVLNAGGIDIYPYGEWWDHAGSLQPGTRILCDPATTNIRTFRLLEQRYKVIGKPSLVALEKAVKNPVEIENIRRTMISDGVALEKFFYWLERQSVTNPVTELSAAEKLENFRKGNPDYRGHSFATISSFGPHGAIIHYTPSAETDIALESDGIYLLDSGGQYLSGTTDVTRTISTGKATKQQRSDFTMVLKGMIALAVLKFPAGTKGCQIDILARHALWTKGLNYGHGTGHGVGFFLNVHEGPQSISAGAQAAHSAAIVPGMVISNEPGLYRENEYGIRTENLMLCVPDEETAFGRFYTFETLTLCHIDKKLIDPGLLTGEEKEWLNLYHQRVFNLLSPGLSAEERKWLKDKTAPL